jgi:hypothetical protein
MPCTGGTGPGLAMPFFIVRRGQGPLAWPSLEPDIFAEERDARAAALARGITGEWWIVEAKDVREALRKAARGY